MLTSGMTFTRALLRQGLPLAALALLAYLALFSSLTPGGRFESSIFRLPVFPQGSGLGALGALGALFGRGAEEGPGSADLTPRARERLEAIQGMRRKRGAPWCRSVEELPLFLGPTPGSDAFRGALQSYAAMHARCTLPHAMAELEKGL